VPYIERRLRDKIDDFINQLDIAICDTAIVEDDCREVLAKLLAYTFFKLLKRRYANDRAGWYLRGDASKILNSIEAEFRRRFISPYEDKAKERNGDVE